MNFINFMPKQSTMQSRKPCGAFLFLVSLTIAGCSSIPLLKSTWDNNTTVVDGKENDWRDNMAFLTDEQVSVGVRNDSANIFVIFKTTSRQQSFQFFGPGFTVWFDPDGGEDKNFGIHFPIGRRGRGDGPLLLGTDQGDDIARQMQKELEIIQKDKGGPTQITPLEAKGIELSIKSYDDYLVYEMKVPLHASPDHPFAINASGKSLGVGFETGKIEARQSVSRDDGGGEGMPAGGTGGGFGGRGGRGGRGGGGGRGRGGIQNGERPKQIDFWMKVNLAQSARPPAAF